MYIGADETLSPYTLVCTSSASQPAIVCCANSKARCTESVANDGVSPRPHTPRADRYTRQAGESLRRHAPDPQRRTHPTHDAALHPLPWRTWVAEQSVAAVNPRAAIITFNLGAGSGIYSRAFHDPARFQQLLQEAAKTINPGNPPQFKPIVLSSFSAGYGSIREILRNHDNWRSIDRVVLVDSLHTGYIPDGAPGPLDPAPLQPFLDFAREAAAGKKVLVFTHSEIFPGTFASTTETANYLITTLGLKQHPILKWGPGGMQQLGDIHVKGLHILGFAGNSAPDHIDQFHALQQWLRIAK